MEHFDLILHKIIRFNERLMDLFWFSEIKISEKNASDFSIEIVISTIGHILGFVFA